MKVLVYKRTHEGDPDPQTGCFGVSDCMGSVRQRNYEAVIGVGGLGVEARRNGIAGKITWIGIGPHKRLVGKRGPEVVFDHFLYMGTEGPDFREWAPILSHRIYGRNVRSIIDGLTSEELEEAVEIVRMASRSLPSRGLSRHSIERTKIQRKKCRVHARRRC